MQNVVLTVVCSKAKTEEKLKKIIFDFTIGKSNFDHFGDLKKYLTYSNRIPNFHFGDCSLK